MQMSVRWLILSYVPHKQIDDVILITAHLIMGGITTGVRMHKNISALEIVKGDNAYTLMFKDGASAGELLDVLCEMRAYVVAHINSAIEKEQQPCSSTNEPVEQEV